MSKSKRNRRKSNDDEEFTSSKTGELSTLKRNKVEAKSQFAKQKLKLLEEHEPARIAEARSNLIAAEEAVSEALSELLDYYQAEGDTANEDKCLEETEQINNELVVAIERSHQTKNDSPKKKSVTWSADGGPEDKVREIGHDLWKQLSRISIPSFSGDKRAYQSWKAAFMTCVDTAPATPEYKLLQLRSSLKGEALKAVENLGHSAMAYQTAKERLERKFGGSRRQIAIFMEELDQFRPIRPGVAKDIERLADLLDIITVNLRENGRTEELGDGSLYLKIQKKLSEEMLTNYRRWVFENNKAESVDNIKSWVIREAEFQTVATETIKGIGALRHREHAGHVMHADSQGHQGHDETPKEQLQGSECIVCGSVHPIWKCEQLKLMDVKSRWEVAKTNRLCFRCLGRNHRGEHCPRSRTCGVNGCQKVHSRLLHTNAPTARQTGQAAVTMATAGSTSVTTPAVSVPIATVSLSPTEGEQGNEREEQTMNAVKCSNIVNFTALRTVPVILSNGRKELKVNALLDDGSTASYINADVAAELGLEGEAAELCVNTISGKTTEFATMAVQFTLVSEDKQIRKKVSANTIESITGKMRPTEWRIESRKWPHLKDIPFPSLGTRPVIDLLIGVDYADLHSSLREVSGIAGAPIARLTPLGWTCVGKVSENKNGAAICNYNWSLFAEPSEGVKMVNETLQKFWKIESVGNSEITTIMSCEESDAVIMLERSMTRRDGHYEVAIPWKKDPSCLPNNFEIARDRLRSLEKRLMKDGTLSAAYAKVIADHVTKGYVTKLDVRHGELSAGWYLPHFGISRPDKATTKMRVVFDASVKCEGVSMNDIIHCGPKLQNNVFDVLLRFRRHPIALVSDVAEMYLRIGIAEKDRPYHRFLWRDFDQTRAPDVYEFNRLVFGVNCCPFQAQYVTQQHAKKNSDQWPRAAETVTKSTYMDDSLDSVQTESEAIALYKQLAELWDSAGMHARKWLSNSSAVLENIPEGDRASEIDLDSSVLPKVKTLGVLWQATNDCFRFNAVPVKEDFQLTKRTFLSRISSLFDPLGFLGPYVIRGKVLMQDVWLSGIGWDEAIRPNIEKKIRRWFAELSGIVDVQIPRCVGLAKPVKKMSLHFFSDASTSAYAAVVYARKEYEDDDVTVRLVASKTRVAPVQATTIPRLELLGATMSAQLIGPVAKALQVDKADCHFWSDSMNVLWWLQRRSRMLKTFVANRVVEIQEKTVLENWTYVNTKLNPADLATRGMSIDDLVHSEFWLNGPEFLALSTAEWPKHHINEPGEASRELKRKTGDLPWAMVTMTTDCANDADWRLEPSRFSSWTKLKRVTAWVQRFVHNCQATHQGRQSGELIAAEIEDSETLIIRKCQEGAFQPEVKELRKKKPVASNSKLIALNPFVDGDGLVRANTRLKFADHLPYDVRNPIILPRDDWVTNLVVGSYHGKDGHIRGTNHVLADVSERFWVVKGREVIRQIERDCSFCKRRKAKTAQQVMAPLQQSRVALPLRAFARASVDFGGPFVTVQGRGKAKIKRYLCLFTCMTSRAVHLEMAYSLDTDAFLNAFYRMTCRRGLPDEMTSDNGTNFVGGSRELKELVDALDQDKISRSAADRGVKWNFNPPAAPHFGGVHETMIKSAKRAVNAVLKNADVKDEELMTVFIGVESLLNSRPLTYQSANPEDDTPITPSHFLHGQVGGRFAAQSVDETPFNPKRRWRRVQELVRHFWQRWMREWLPGLGTRAKWRLEREDVKVGDVVLVVETGTARGSWPLGRITQVFPGPDGHVRVVNIATKGKDITRPITKICPLDL